MFDSISGKVLLLVLIIFIIGILYFIFYPAIVSYRKCRTNNGNIITLTTMKLPDGSQDEKNQNITKIEQEVNTNFTIREMTSTATIKQSSTAVTTSTHVMDVPILSIVIPAYDEEQRLPTMLHAAYSYLNQSSSSLCPAMQDLVAIIHSSTNNNNTNVPSSLHIEWIVVNDGSKDQTSLAYERFIQQQQSTLNSNRCRMIWKLISFSKNCGKGAAVQAGMMLATGQFRLMVDADGATDFGPGLHLLTQRLKNEMQIEQSTTISSSSSNEGNEFPIIFGSRAHLHQSSSSVNDLSPQEQQQKRSVIRSFLMQAFHVCVMLLVGSGSSSNSNNNKQRRRPITDTQCGFKLFPASAAQRLFSILHLQRWAFDIELVYIIQSLLHYNCIEVVVPWKEIDGSKLNTSPYNLAMVAICMLRDMICVRLCYTLGIWNINTTNVMPPEQQGIIKKDR